MSSRARKLQATLSGRQEEEASEAAGRKWRLRRKAEGEMQKARAVRTGRSAVYLRPLVGCEVVIEGLFVVIPATIDTVRTLGSVDDVNAHLPRESGARTANGTSGGCTERVVHGASVAVHSGRCP